MPERPAQGSRPGHAWTPERSVAGNRNPWLVTSVIAISAFMEVLDTAIANVSLNHIAGATSSSYDQATWVLTSYLIANAIVIPMSGWLSDVFGRKRYYMTSVAIFTFASLCCGLAPSLGFLIVARILQGVGGGGLQPVTQAMLIDTFPPASRGKAMSVYGFTVILAPMIGPLLGGWITDQFSWHWIFLINVPVGLLSLTLVETMVDEPPLIVEERRQRWARGVHFDLPGAALIALALGSLEVMLDRGVQEDWFASPLIRGAALVAGACLLAFVLWEIIERDPLLDMSLFRYRSFASATFIIMTIGVILFGTTQFIPQLVQEVLGYTAEQAGLALTLGGIVTLFTMPLAGILSGYVQPRILMGCAFAVEALAMWHMSHFATTVTFSQIALARMWQGAPIPFLFVPLISAAYVGVPGAKTNRASAMISVGRNLGGSIGISLVQALLARRQQFHQARLVLGLQPLNPVYAHGIHALTRTLTARGAPPAAASRMAIGALYRIVQRQADMMAFNDVFWVLAIFIVLTLPTIFLLKRAPLQHAHARGSPRAATQHAS
ncbi:MAG TPA: DHA2 family efflux MFS transporter permease subunit [Steroidobacteraceae bacterium]|nr:DHA2 family efflux MFS transporter permease subunit [Steroidobacteraceae bacterium]